jgi:hypothetical protein
MKGGRSVNGSKFSVLPRAACSDSAEPTATISSPPSPGHDHPGTEGVDLGVERGHVLVHRLAVRADQYALGSDPRTQVFGGDRAQGMRRAWVGMTPGRG